MMPPTEPVGLPLPAIYKWVNFFVNLFIYSAMFCSFIVQGMGEEGQIMIQNESQSTTADTQVIPHGMNGMSGPMELGDQIVHDLFRKGGDGTNALNHSRGGSTVVFSKENSNFEFSKLNQCVEASRKFGEISVDDAETLTFFLELVKETLTAGRYLNA